MNLAELIGVIAYHLHTSESQRVHVAGYEGRTRVGPKTEPCGMPLHSGLASEVLWQPFPSTDLLY